VIGTEKRTPREANSAANASGSGTSMYASQLKADLRLKFGTGSTLTSLPSKITPSALNMIIAPSRRTIPKNSSSGSGPRNVTSKPSLSR